MQQETPGKVEPGARRILSGVVSDTLTHFPSVDADAHYRKGLAHLKGNGVQHDRAEAVRWLSVAAEQNHADAAWELAFIYLDDDCAAVPQDYAQVIFWLHKAAAWGHLRAQLILGRCHQKGHESRGPFLRRFIPQDYEQAVYWYLKAAEKGDTSAQYELGKCYEKGHGVPQDLDQAAHWFRLAHKGARCQVVKEATETFAMYGMKEDAGHFTAMLKVAKCGNRLLEARANFWLGLFYEKVGRNLAEAVASYRKSAEVGDSLAQHWLATCHEDGRGVPQDPVEAYKWFKLAGECQQPRSGKSSAEKLALLSAIMTPDQIQEGERRYHEFRADARESASPIRGNINEC